MTELPNNNEPENVFAVWELFLDRRESDASAANSAIDCILNAIFPSLFRAAFFRVRDHSTAEDLVQESLTRFLSWVGRHCTEELKDIIPDEARLRGYFYRILHNVHEDFRKVVERRREFPFDVGQEEIADSSRQEGEMLANTEMMRKAVQCLGGKDRNLIVMRYFEDSPVADMSVSLSITPEHVRVLLKRARDRLRIIYQKLSGERY